MAIFYLTLRRNYGRLLDRPEMFENNVRQRYEEQLERERAALAEAQRLANLGSHAPGRSAPSVTLFCHLF